MKTYTDKGNYIYIEPTFFPKSEESYLYRQFLQELQNGEAELIQPTPEPTPQVSPVELAEQHVSSYFSTPKLLQMKVWWDTFPHTDTPKLSAVYDWTNNITIQAAQGQTNFVAPSYTFDDLLTEAISLVNL